MPMQKQVKTLCLCAALLCCALLISYIESVLPLSLLIPIPGVKSGFANIAIMVCFYTVGKLPALAVSVCRVLFSAVIFGSITSFWFSLCGAVFAYLGLVLCDTLIKNKVSVIGTSVLCAALHCVGQICAVCVILGSTDIIFYLGILLLASLVTGTISGIVAELVLHSKAIKRQDAK